MLVQEVPSCTAGNERRLQRKSVSAPVCTFTATSAVHSDVKVHRVRINRKSEIARPPSHRGGYGDPEKRQTNRTKAIHTR